ncbi:MAG TPA: tetratricopeptide repeat protein [Opitutaceae bacterium]|nr:tetratricopeptide repeat protein [Opitutaceae bacterium]
MAALGAAALLAACLAIYGQTGRAGWIWDDGLYITGNPALRTAGGLGRIWIDPPGINYFPLTETAQWLQWHLWQARPAGYHLTNLALQALSALLFWRLLRRLGVGAFGAWAGALLFAVHPLGVESVAWASELKNTLSLPLLLGAMLAWIGADERGRRGAYALSLALFVLALLAKSTVAMLPVVLLGHAAWKRGRLGAADFRRAAPFFAASALLGLVAVHFERTRAIGAAAAGPGLAARLGEAGQAAVFYLGKCLFPVGLMPVYPRWTPGPLWADAAAWAVLAVVTLFLLKRRRGWGRGALLGWLFFLANLAPVLGLVPMAYQRISWVADHFCYLSLLAVAGLAGAGLDLLWRRLPAAAGFLLAGIALVLAGESRAYAAVFRDGPALWSEAVRRNPRAWLAHNNLGKIELEQGRAGAAAAEFQAALRIESGSAEAHANLGNAWLGLGRPEDATGEYAAALRLDPSLAGAQYDWANALLAMGRPAQAQPRYEAALRLRPDYPSAENNLGLALARQRRWAEALQHYRRALRLDPGLPEAWLNLGNALFSVDRPGEAEPAFRQALRLNPRYAAAHHGLGLTLAALGREAEAAAELAEAEREQRRP